MPVFLQFSFQYIKQLVILAYTWIYEFIPKSEFWGNWVKTTNRENWDKETFTEQIALRINKEVDVELKVDLEALYYYVKD